MGIGTDAARLAHDAFQDALKEVAENVLAKAAGNVGVGDPALDPAPAIALAKSGHLVQDGDGIIVIFDTEYAAAQHENLHAKHPRGGGAKYLERAVTEIVPTLDNVVASKVEARLRSGMASRAKAATPELSDAAAAEGVRARDAARDQLISGILGQGRGG
jgi:hypothetical protein